MSASPSEQWDDHEDDTPVACDSCGEECRADEVTPQSSAPMIGRPDYLCPACAPRKRVRR